LHAADTLGAAQAMLDMAVAYAGTREQFGRVIGSFQAVKHLCAEMAAALEPCRALTWYAAHALSALPAEAELYACHAKAHLAEVGSFIARTATEVHGGMGFTDLLGLHYWFKRIGLNRQLLGTTLKITLNNVKYQYSLRRARPLNCAYFLSTARYQSIMVLPCFPITSSRRCWG
jgi:alkylation response protein AidB-like acyl-CoA dehydrogenase